MLRTDKGYASELEKGISAFEKEDYEKAREILNKLIETRIGVVERQEAQWYLARIAEEQGELNEARQQYALFIQNFPSNSHATEAKERLAALSSIRDPPTETFETGPAIRQREVAPRYGRLSGTMTTEYLYDHLLSSEPAIATQNMLNQFLDLRWRKMVGMDMRINFLGSYSQGFLDQQQPRSQISKLFAEWNRVMSVLDLRMGRQPSSGNTLFSRFDGTLVVYRPLSTINLNASAGYPIHTSNTPQVEIQSDHLFYDTYLTLYDFYHLGGKIYYTQEFKEGLSARNAVGINGYWLKEPVNLTFILDYDIDFGKFNDELIGLEYTHLNIRYSGTVEYRKTPFLDFETALLDPSLIGTNMTTLAALKQTKTVNEIRSLTLANTSNLLDFQLGTAVDFSKVWRGDFRYAHTISEVVDFTVGRARKTADRFSMFLSERNGLNFSEAWTLLALYQMATDSQTMTLTSSLSEYWNSTAVTSLRVRWDHTEFKTSGTRSSRTIPGFSFSLSFKNGTQVSLEGDYAIEKTSASPDTLTTVQTRTSITIPF
jgi:tetratricopeptide (TPR) repeat protein